ncbi:hypothetical protein TUM12151_15320 [Morganella morganii]|nr:hypothetical protein [Morganella morganii]GIZ28590.1 hypothetical protein TUM12149_25600 [Morganella morganii]GIZ34546.1 hypothetical protein TUM12151_15320 [Morganella morganii]HEO9719493.1 hypothetical protein [Morganella morganii subsp. morganii]
MKNIVIRLDADIVPGKSIGGVSLSDNVSDVIRCINSGFTIKKHDISNSVGKFFLYKINGGAISFTSDEHGVIIALWCEPPYSGSYKNKLYPGITASKLNEVSKKQEIIKGYLVIDKYFHVYYGMPEDIDDFDCFSDLNDDVIFNELYVGDLG